MIINTTDAPAGHKAAPQQSSITPCHGCAFLAVGAQFNECKRDSNVSCISYRRSDEQTVIFVKA